MRRAPCAPSAFGVESPAASGRGAASASESGQPRFTAPPPLALYVHLPWCIRRCPYCDFNSHVLPAAHDEMSYVDALIADLDAELPRVEGRTVCSVFIGGGTPSLFSERAVERLLGAVDARLGLSPDVEVTLEANPGAADRRRFRGFARAGVTRLSVGAQSFRDPLLAAIGRVHDAREARDAVRSALASGVSRVNVDLMFGLPGQAVADVSADVSAAVTLGVDHVSFYQLTLEPNTAFYRDPPALPSEDALVEMHEAGLEVLARGGFHRYEVSAFARSGSRCQHNVNYWRFGDYLGIGAGAHGKVTMLAEHAVVRTVKERHPARYQAAAAARGAVASERRVDSRDLPFEFMLNALRLTEGFEKRLFCAATGLALQHVAKELRRSASLGLLDLGAGRIKPTALGQRYLNDLVARFLPRE